MKIQYRVEIDGLSILWEVFLWKEDKYNSRTSTFFGLMFIEDAFKLWKCMIERINEWRKRGYRKMEKDGDVECFVGSGTCRIVEATSGELKQLMGDDAILIVRKWNEGCA